MASASPISYIYTGDIVGTLDGVPVEGALTLTATGDTSSVTGSSGDFRNASVVSVFNLAGIGPFTITNPTYVFDNQGASKVGFGVNGIPNCCDIVQHVAAPYLTYDLLTAIGPISAPANLSLFDFDSIPTTAGLFTVTSMTNNTFQAVTDLNAQVPEPATYGMLLSGAAAIWLLRRRA